MANVLVFSMGNGCNNIPFIDEIAWKSIDASEMKEAQKTSWVNNTKRLYFGQ